MTQFIEPNEKSDLRQDVVRNWISQAYTGVVSGFAITPGASGFLLTISSGVCWINGTRIHDDETRIDFDLSVTGGVDKHVSIIARHTPAAVFPAPAMVIEAITNNDTTVPTLPADSVKLADIFIGAGDADIGDSRIVQAPLLPARGNNDGDTILDRLIASNMNVVFGGGGSFQRNSGGANTTLKWTEDISLVATTITNKEKFSSVPLAAYRILAGTLGPDPGDFTAPGVDHGAAEVRDNCIVFGVMDRLVANNPATPIDIGLKVIDLDDPDVTPANTTDANLFYDPVREKVVFLGAMTNGVLKFRSGISSPLPPPAVNPNWFLRNDPGGVHYWSAITEDIVVSILAITGLSDSHPVIDPGDHAQRLELGDDVGTGAVEHDPLTFSASYANGPPTSTAFNATGGDAYAGDDPLAQDPGAGANFTYTGPVLQKTATGANQSVTFQLIADAGDTPDSQNRSINWYRRAYVGGNAVDPGATNYDNAFLKALMNKTGTGTGGANFNGEPVNASQLFSGRVFRWQVTLANEFMYIAWDAGHGDITQIKDKNNSDQNVFGAFQKVDAGGASGLITTENAAAIGENYIVYKSINLLTGTFDYETA